MYRVIHGPWLEHKAAQLDTKNMNADVVHERTG